MERPSNITISSGHNQYIALFQHALDVREMLERAWTNETAYQGIILQPDDPKSRGQCGVSSVLLSRYLLGMGYKTKFTEGLIYVANGEGDEHVWVEVQNEDEEPLVVDITSDQYNSSLYDSSCWQLCRQYRDYWALHTRTVF